MSLLVRLWETLSRTPHRHDDAQRVRRATQELTENAKILSAHLRTHEDSPDPLMSIVCDLVNRRQMEID